jgi:hypothetical protein
MGFLDKAKKIAEQAQTKLDEVQSQINTQGGPNPPSGPIVEYDKHGRPIPPQQTASPPHGDPLAGAVAPPPGESAAGPPPMPGVPPTEPPSGPPAPVEGTVAPPPAPGMPGGNDEDRNRPSYAPPKLTGGDPLAG